MRAQELSDMGEADLRETTRMRARDREPGAINQPGNSACRGTGVGAASTKEQRQADTLGEDWRQEPQLRQVPGLTTRLVHTPHAPPLTFVGHTEQPEARALSRARLPKKSLSRAQHL